MLPYTTYLLDLDGVVYRGSELLPGAHDFLLWLERTHKKYLFLTNNSFATGEQILAKLNGLGVVTEGAHLLTAGQAAVQNIARRLPGGSIYVVGEQPLREFVTSYGLNVVPVESAEAQAVLVGLDRTFDYTKMTNASNAVRAGALFIAINRDPVLPVPGGLVPGCGSMVASIECASGTSPEVVGKPEPMLLREALAILGSTPEETVMVGDSLAIDILAGQRAGTHTLFVLSGSNSHNDIARLRVTPEHVYANLAEVLREQESA